MPPGERRTCPVSLLPMWPVWTKLEGPLIIARLIFGRCGSCQAAAAAAARMRVEAWGGEERAEGRGQAGANESAAVRLACCAFMQLQGIGIPMAACWR